jgi:hypothetical protein
VDAGLAQRFEVLLVRVCWHERCSLSKKIPKRRLDHAVDNFGDPIGLVARWLAHARRRRPNPLASSVAVIVLVINLVTGRRAV